jgi:hypothetical protein
MIQSLLSLFNAYSMLARGYDRMICQTSHEMPSWVILGCS